MGLRINTNIEAIDAQRNLELTSMDFQKAIQRLSTGLRINSAADGPADLAVSQTLTGQINGYDQAQRNIQDGVSMTQVADSALNSTAQALQRMRTLSVQAATDSLTNTDRSNIQAEIKDLVSEIDRIASQTEFNSKKLLDGSAGGAQIIGSGGSDVLSITAEGQVALQGNYSFQASVKNVAATKSALESGTFNVGQFTQASAITITGPSNTSQTFTVNSGEDVNQFIADVNEAGIGVTAQVDQTTGLLQLVNNTYGLKGADANGNNNATGSVAVSVSNLSGDFAFGGAISFSGLDGSTTGNVNSAGKYTAGTAAVNAVQTVSGPVAANQIVATGINSDTLTGTGMPGVTIVLSNPGNVVGNDAFSIQESSLLNIQSSPNEGEAIKVGFNSQRAITLGVANLDLTSQASAEAAITTVTNAINTLSVQRSAIGSLQNGLTDALSNASLSEQNLQSARSNLIDANIATETVTFTKDQILLQAGTSVLAQANQAPLGLLSLLK